MLSPELNAALLCGGDALGLSLADELALRLRNIGEDLQNKVGDEGAGQISGVALSSIEQRHIQNKNRRLLFLCDRSPLLEDLLIIASEAVDALDVERVPRL